MALYALGEHRPRVHPTAYVHPDATVVGRVHLSAGANVWPGAVLRADFGEIRIGERTSVQDGTVVHTTDRWPTIIGDACIVGHAAHLEGCTVESRCLIGSGSLVLNRAVVEEGSVVAAQAVVTEGMVVPTGSMAIGIPARVRPVDAERHLHWIEMATQMYVHNAQRYGDQLQLVTEASCVWEEAL